MKVRTPIQRLAIEKKCSILLWCFLVLFSSSRSIAQNTFCQELAIAYALPDDAIERKAYKKVVQDLTYIFSTLSNDCCSYISLVEVNEMVGRAEKILEMVNEAVNTPIIVKLREPKFLLSVNKTGFEAGNYQFYLKFEQLYKVPGQKNAYTLEEARETSIISFTIEDLLTKNEDLRRKKLGKIIYRDIEVRCEKLKAFLGIDESQLHTIIIKGPSGARIFVDGEFKNTTTVKLTLVEGYYYIQVKSDSMEWSRDIHLSNPRLLNIEESELKSIRQNQD